MATATLLPMARAVFFDANGDPLSGGFVYTYVPGGSVPKLTWEDSAQSTPNANPIVLDSAGSCLLYGTGSYQLTVTDSNGNAVPGYSGLTTVSLSTINFSTVASLRLNNTAVTAPAAVYVEGYAASADGGEGWFVYNPSSIAADNGGTIIVDAFGNHWYRDTSGNPAYVEMFGAKGDGATDDSASINAALSSCAAVAFTPGKTYFIATSLVVPVACQVIDGRGAVINGPGTNVSGGSPGVTVDGFTFANFWQGGGTILPTDNAYRLPSVKNCRYGVVLTSCAWVNIETDLIQYCASGIQMNALGSGLASYLVENEIKFGTIEFCSAGIDIRINAASTLGMQGCKISGLYIAGPQYGIKYTFDTTGVAAINNAFDITVVDGNNPPATPAYSIYANLEAPSNGNNHYNFPGGAVNFANASHVSGIGFNNINVMGFQSFQGTDPYVLGWDNFAPAGPRTTLNSGIGTYVHVSPSGSDSTGTGSASAPFLTMQAALTHIQNMDMLGSAMNIQLAAGTYPDQLVYNAEGGFDIRGPLNIVGNTGNAASVVLTGGVSVNGPGAYVTLTGLTMESSAMASSGGSIVVGSSVGFGNATGVHLSAVSGGVISLSAAYIISGGAVAHFYADTNGIIAPVAPLLVTLSGTPAFSQAFAVGARCGVVRIGGVSYSGSATGPRYLVSLNAVVDTDTGNTSYLPGSTGGSVTTGGQIN